MSSIDDLIAEDWWECVLPRSREATRPAPLPRPGWERIGRGRVFEFVATHGELVEILRAALPEEFAPYRLVGCDLLRASGQRRHVEAPFTCDGLDFTACASRVPEGGVPRNIFYLQSEALTSVTLPIDGDVSFAFTGGGLIQVSPGRTLPRGKEPSTLGMVDRIRTVDGLPVRHGAYFKVFQALREHIQSRLVSHSVVHYPDGSVVPGPMISRDALDEIGRGIPYTVTPTDPSPSS